MTRADLFRLFLLAPLAALRGVQKDAVAALPPGLSCPNAKGHKGVEGPPGYGEVPYHIHFVGPGFGVRGSA